MTSNISFDTSNWGEKITVRCENTSVAVQAIIEANNLAVNGRRIKWIKCNISSGDQKIKYYFEDRKKGTSVLELHGITGIDITLRLNGIKVTNVIGKDQSRGMGDRFQRWRH